MGEYEDAVQRLRDEGLDDQADAFEKFSNQSMRQRVGRTAELERENETLKGRVKALEDTPKREAALKAARVDVSALRPAELQLISQESADEYDEGWAKGLVEKYKLPVAPEEEGGEGVSDDLKKFTQPGGPNETEGKGPSSKATLSPEVFSTWAPDKRMGFREWCEKQGKMDMWEALLRGESVTGVTFHG